MKASEHSSDLSPVLIPKQITPKKSPALSLQFAKPLSLPTMRNIYRDSEAFLKLIIQIPAFNEEQTIAQTLRDLPQKIDGIDVIETLIIDDGSSDATSDAARRAGATHVVRLNSHRGLSAAFLAGIDGSLRLGADIIVNTDADNQYSGDGIARLIAPILDRKADVVIGDRDTRNSPYMPAWKRFLQRAGSRAVSIASGLEVADVTSGMRAFSREAALQINVFNPFTYTLETIIQAGNRNLQIASVMIGTNAPTRPSRLYRSPISYLRKSFATVVRIYVLYKPLKTFFVLGMLLLLGGVAVGARFLYFYLTGDGGGHIQSLILAAILLIVGVQTNLIGLVADLISVNRRLSEELLIRMKKLELPHLPQQKLQQQKQSRRPKAQPAGSQSRPQREPVKVVAPLTPPAEAEPQWVWLVDESEIDSKLEKSSPPAPSGGPASAPSTSRRRRRRRAAHPQFQEPRDRRPHGAHEKEKEPG